MIDDERWRDELLRALGREPSHDDLLAVEVAVAAHQHRRAVVLLAGHHGSTDAPCGQCGSYPREAGEPCPGSPEHRALLRRSDRQLAEALALLGLTEPH